MQIIIYASDFLLQPSHQMLGHALVYKEAKGCNHHWIEYYMSLQSDLLNQTGVNSSFGIKERHKKLIIHTGAAV